MNIKLTADEMSTIRAAFYLLMRGPHAGVHQSNVKGILTKMQKAQDKEKHERL